MSAVPALTLALIGLLVAPMGATADPVTLTRHVFPNGLTLLLREDPAAEVVVVSLQVRTGSRDEAPETAGITNFVQRTMVRGSARYSAAELVEATEDIGGAIDASGETESAEIQGRALARHWERLLELVAEVALRPTFPPAEIETERRLLLNQMKSRDDNPFPLAFDTMLRDLYGRHPFARPSLGLAGSVERLTREELLARYQRMYRPDALVLALSGSAPRERVARVVDRLFGKMIRGEPVPRARLESPVPAGGSRLVERPVHQAQILIGYLTPGLADTDHAAVQVLGAVLGGGMSGRLFIELRERRGLAYSVRVLTSPFRTTPALFVAQMGTARESVESAEAGMLAEIERVRRDGVSDGEVARAKAYVLGTFGMDRRTNARLAWHLAFFEAVGVGWDFSDRYTRAVEAVTPVDVLRVARQYLARPTIVVVRPPR